MTRSFSESTKDFSPERLERIEQRKEQLRQEMTLVELRRAFALTQDTLAKNSTSSRASLRKALDSPLQLGDVFRDPMQHKSSIFGKSGFPESS